MCDAPRELKAILYRRSDRPRLHLEVSRFRKQLFADQLGWILKTENGLEQDQFDTDLTEYCALLENGQLKGCFRAIRCDRPYLVRDAFPGIAPEDTFPADVKAWEISRFGVHPDRSGLAISLYAAMFEFAERRGARALPALVDLRHERWLNRLGVQTRRYGDPRPVGHDVRGRVLFGVAGEIPIHEQRRRLGMLFAVPRTLLEVTDETSFDGFDRVSA